MRGTRLNFTGRHLRLSTLFVAAAAGAVFAAEDEMLLLSSYEPTYFVVGRHHATTARFQFSFKYKLFDADTVPTKYFPPLSGLHFAYTQAAVWDLSSESKPLRDSSYRPSFLYQWTGETHEYEQPAWRLQTGAEHESNGKEDARSRSINTLFIHPSRRFELDGGEFFSVGARLIAYVDREENSDIADYRGIGNFELSFGKADGAIARTTTRIGKSGHGSFQLDLSYPLRRQYFANTGGYVYAQYFNGTGETLLDHNVRRPQQLRFGFAIVR